MRRYLLSGIFLWTYVAFFVFGEETRLELEDLNEAANDRYKRQARGKLFGSMEWFAALVLRDE